MDVETAVGSVLAAFALSGAAGLNAWLPLLVSALLDRFEIVDLAGPFDEFSSTPGLVVLGTLTVADFVGDKVPIVDHLLHGVGAFIAPVSGAILFTGSAGSESDVPTLVSLILGALVAGSVHAARTTARPAATATTGGLANPVVSLGEDATSGLLTALAFIAPVVAVALLVALLGALVVLVRRLRGALRRHS